MKFWVPILEVKILVKVKIIKISKNTIRLDKITENNTFLFFLDVLVTFDTLETSLKSILNFFTFLTILLDINKQVNNS